MDIEKDKDSLLDEEPLDTHTVELRADVLFPKKYETVGAAEQYLKLESEVQFDPEPTDEGKLREEATNIFNSKKVRDQLYRQAVEKVRWRTTAEDRLASNSTLVKWSDGSFGIYIGADYYDLPATAHGNHLVFAEDAGVMVSVDKVAYSATMKKKKRDL